jgi:hypothetical protein
VNYALCLYPMLSAPYPLKGITNSALTSYLVIRIGYSVFNFLLGYWLFGIGYSVFNFLLGYSLFAIGYSHLLTWLFVIRYWLFSPSYLVIRYSLFVIRYLTSSLVIHNSLLVIQLPHAQLRASRSRVSALLFHIGLKRIFRDHFPHRLSLSKQIGFCFTFEIPCFEKSLH